MPGKQQKSFAQHDVVGAFLTEPEPIEEDWGSVQPIDQGERKKPSSAAGRYMRLDMRPTWTKENLYAHVRASARRDGISETKFVQQLIIDDMRNGEKSMRKLVSDKLSELTDDNLILIDKIVTSLITQQRYD